MQTGATKETKIRWPSFDGQNLPLVGEFLDELQNLLIQAGVPVSGRGAILAQSFQGQAKHILNSHTQDINPNFKDQAKTLRDHFGQVGTQMDLLQRLHKNHGRIPAIHDIGQSITSIYNTVKGHITLLKSVANLHKQYQNNELIENPISGSYLNALEKFLPRDAMMRLSETPGYGTTLETKDRFTLLTEAYQRIQNYASAEIAKHGYETEEQKPKKLKHLQFMITNEADQQSTGQGQPSNNTQMNPPPGPPQFNGNPPTVQLPLPPARQPLNGVQCFKCWAPGHYANACPNGNNRQFCTTCHTTHPNNQCPKSTNNPSTNPPWRKPTLKTLTTNPDGTATTQYGGQQVQLKLIDQGLGYFRGDVCCFVCKVFAQHRNQPQPPPTSSHVFTPSGKLEKSLCPCLTSLPSIESRVKELDRYSVCRTCLASTTMNPQYHAGNHCSILSMTNNQQHKCANSGCRREI